MSTEYNKHVEQKNQRIAFCLAMVLRKPEGLELFSWILEKTGYMSSVCSIPEQMSFNEGRRSIGHDLCADIAAVSPDIMEKLLIFMAKEKAKNARITNGQPADPGRDLPVYEWGYGSGETEQQ